tara:strand:+ start:87 stop:599 length:513 start_codon:yes stop_codon:yes gene_type:complete
MIVEKFFERKVLRQYFFIQGNVEIDFEYFFKKINEGLKDPKNQTFKTNIQGQMTPWEHFCKDEQFIKLLHKFIDLIDENIKLPSYNLRDSWGFCVNKGGFTKFHSHGNNVWSGVLYLNEHDQTLDFPEINQKVKPEKGKFVLFSSFLNHGCKIHRCENSKLGISFNMQES